MTWERRGRIWAGSGYAEAALPMLHLVQLKPPSPRRCRAVSVSRGELAGTPASPSSPAELSNSFVCGKCNALPSAFPSPPVCAAHGTEVQLGCRLHPTAVGLSPTACPMARDLCFSEPCCPQVVDPPAPSDDPPCPAQHPPVRAEAPAGRSGQQRLGPGRESVESVAFPNGSVVLWEGARVGASARLRPLKCPLSRAGFCSPARMPFSSCLAHCSASSADVPPALGPGCCSTNQRQGLDSSCSH